MTDTIAVLAKRAGDYWELHIAGVGVTQARKLSEAEAMARDLIRRRQETDATAVGLVWSFEVGDEFDAEIKAARALEAEASTAQKEAAVRIRKVARRLKESGLSGRDLALILGRSTGRISQLLGPKARL